MYKQLKLLILALITLLLSNTVIAAILTPEQQQAKQQGILLYQQYHMRKAGEQLLIAAEAGDTEAMVYLGLTFRVIEDLDANKWLEKAAEAGDIYAMYQLTQAMPAWSIAPQMNYKGKSKWQQKGEELALQRAQAGDPESMYIYYRFTGDTKWLEKAANAGYARAQSDYGQTIWKKRWMFESTKKAFAMEWAQKAADNGDVRDMVYLSWSYRDLKDQAKAQAYLLKAVELSYIDAVKTYMYALSEQDNEYGFKIDLVKSYALASFLNDANIGSSGGKSQMEWLTENPRNQPRTILTPEQVKEGEALKKQWAKTHPPLTNGYTKLKTIGDMNSY